MMSSFDRVMVFSVLELIMNRVRRNTSHPDGAILLKGITVSPFLIFFFYIRILEAYGVDGMMIGRGSDAAAVQTGC